MGELIDLNSKVVLTDADIPDAIARDTETAAAAAAHKAETDPHPSLWGKIVAGFLGLTGGQRILKNNSDVSAVSYSASQNHIELATDNGSNPILGFHKIGVSATALYHSGYGDNSIRIRNADGYDSSLLHKSNHLDLIDPHPMYLTQAEGDGRYRNFGPQNFTGSVKTVGQSFGTIISHPNNCGLDVQAVDNNSAAYLAFHRPGIFACHLGLDTDNQFKIGGWSYGGNAYKIWHEGNAGIQNPVTSDYGSIGILGSTNDWAGINFPQAFGASTFMLSESNFTNGVHSQQQVSGWTWLYNAGSFRIFNSGWYSEGSFIGLEKGLDSLPGYPGNRYPTVKTDFANLYFSANGAYSAYMSSNGVWSAVSDREKKENLEETDDAAILELLLAIPTFTYNFKGSDARIRSLGCMAQDFHEAFKLGGDDEVDADDSPTIPSKMMSVSDVTGVCMSAIKALAAEVRLLKSQLSENSITN